jgi:hypothetical protein
VLLLVTRPCNAPVFLHSWSGQAAALLMHCSCSAWLQLLDSFMVLPMPVAAHHWGLLLKSM